MSATSSRCRCGGDLVNASVLLLLYRLMYDQTPFVLRALHVMLRVLGIEIAKPCATQCIPMHRPNANSIPCSLCWVRQNRSLSGKIIIVIPSQCIVYRGLFNDVRWGRKSNRCAIHIRGCCFYRSSCHNRWHRISIDGW